MYEVYVSRFSIKPNRKRGSKTEKYVSLKGVGLNKHFDDMPVRFSFRTCPNLFGSFANIYTLNVEPRDRYRNFAGDSMAFFRSKSAKDKPVVKYHISDNDYYWLASRFCQNMMAFVFAATRFDEDKTAYFEHFFIDFLKRRGISYSIVEIDEANKQLCIIKPWEKGATK